MSFKDFLTEFRTESAQLMLLSLQLSSRPVPTPLEAQLPLRLRRAQTRARRQLLMDQQQATRSRWDMMNETFEQLLRTGGASPMQSIILRQFYGSAMTDRQIAEMLGRSPKTVCCQRLSWVHRMEENQA